jgi:hypothetical protein
VTLRDLVASLPSLQAEEVQYLVPTIYAAEPWAPGSDALVALGSLKGGLPPEAATRQMTRVFEVAGARSILRDCYVEFAEAQRFDELCRIFIGRVTDLANAGIPYAYRRADV